MAEGISEVPIMIEQVHVESGAVTENHTVTHEDFAQIQTEDLISIRKTAAEIKEDGAVDPSRIREAEEFYKESSLELLFRIKGENYRNEYDQWLVIKQRKQQAWEQQMHVKYGTDWEQRVTESDKQLITYSEQEMKIYDRHKLIEEEAIQLEEKDINDLQGKETKPGSEQESMKSFFKLVEAKTAEFYPFLEREEIHQAVNSFEFLFFYMKQLGRSGIKKGFSSLQKKEVNGAVNFEYEFFVTRVYEATSVAKEIALDIRKKPKSQNSILGSVLAA